ncbi:MAG: deoxyribose-phosphate aldolase [candidate division Zixibacteria bacterium]|nr:deoxyribose-phosphate aldolase [candidate division Zixibacteria bacterium]
MNKLNTYFDHALLSSDTTRDDIIRLCHEAEAYALFGIAINPCWVRDARAELDGSNVKIIGVSGFPLSANTTTIKVAEAVQGVEDGADEIDMVANVGWLVAGEYGKVEHEIAAVRRALPHEVPLKVIIETPKLQPDVQIEAVRIIIDAGAQFVKTATGFFGGATVEAVARLKQAAGGMIKVKASGGIRTLADAAAMIHAGADRLGSSASVAIMQELARNSVTEGRTRR